MPTTTAKPRETGVWPFLLLPHKPRLSKKTCPVRPDRLPPLSSKGGRHSPARSLVKAQPGRYTESAFLRPEPPVPDPSIPAPHPPRRVPGGPYGPFRLHHLRFARRSRPYRPCPAGRTAGGMRQHPALARPLPLSMEGPTGRGRGNRARRQDHGRCV